MLKTRAAVVCIKMVWTCVALMVFLLGCGAAPEDASHYLAGLLERPYLGVFDEQKAPQGMTEQEALAVWEEKLEQEADYFCRYFQITKELLSQELYDSLVEFYRELYQYTSFEVGEAVQTGKGIYTVELSIRPIETILLVIEEDLEAYRRDFVLRYEGKDVEKMSDEEYIAYEADWTQGLLELCRERLRSQVSYLPQIQLEVEVEWEEGEFSIYAAQLNTIDTLLLAYERS